MFVPTAEPNANAKPAIIAHILNDQTHTDRARLVAGCAGETQRPSNRSSFSVPRSNRTENVGQFERCVALGR